MLSWIVGAVHSNAAWVLVVMFISHGAVATALVVKRKSATYMSNQFTVAKLKQADDHALLMAKNATGEKVDLAQIASKQSIEIARISGAQIEHAKLVGGK